MDEISELLGLLEENPSVEFSTLIKDEEENFKVHLCMYIYICMLYLSPLSCETEISTNIC